MAVTTRYFNHLFFAPFVSPTLELPGKPDTQDTKHWTDGREVCESHGLTAWGRGGDTKGHAGPHKAVVGRLCGTKRVWFPLVPIGDVIGIIRIILWTGGTNTCYSRISRKCLAPLIKRVVWVDLVHGSRAGRGTCGYVIWGPSSFIKCQGIP